MIKFHKYFFDLSLITLNWHTEESCKKLNFKLMFTDVIKHETIINIVDHLFSIDWYNMIYGLLILFLTLAAAWLILLENV